MSQLPTSSNVGEPVQRFQNTDITTPAGVYYLTCGDELLSSGDNPSPGTTAACPLHGTQTIWHATQIPSGGTI